MSPVVSSSICWSKREIQAVDWARQKVVIYSGVEFTWWSHLLRCFCHLYKREERWYYADWSLSVISWCGNGYCTTSFSFRLQMCTHSTTRTRALLIFGGSKYYVNLRSFYVWLPWIVIPTVTIVLSPLEGSTMNFALGNNFFSTYIGFACCLSILVLTPVCFAHL